LSHTLSPVSACFLASWRDRPVALSSWLPEARAGVRTRREHRTVVLPDYQGVGIGAALGDFLASLWSARGWRATSTTTHPGLIRSRRRSPLWHMHRAPGFGQRQERRRRHATTRITASFTYVGPPMPRLLADTLLE
jgi:GNAT superfamily N-acetyltransferase